MAPAAKTAEVTVNLMVKCLVKEDKVITSERFQRLDEDDVE